MPGHDAENVSLRRDCEAVLVPQGDHVLIRAGARVVITQKL